MKISHVAALALFVAACAGAQRLTAVAAMAPTSGSQATGSIRLTEVDEDGVRVDVELDNVPPGTHGFHIHEKGDCGDNGNAAGPHFNPAASAHGAPGEMPHHAGDFGNVTADEAGRVRTSFTTRSITLQPGEASALGRAFILHANPDDLKTQPTGNAGARIACGVVRFQ